MTYAPRSVCDYYLALFAGRADVYAAWTGDIWLPQREQLTGETVEKAMRERRSLSFYFLRPDNSTHVAAFDLDRQDGMTVAARLGERLRLVAIPSYAVPSEGGRAHLWIVADERLPGVVWRHALRAALQAAGLPTDDPHVELRPGQDALRGPDGLGSPLRAPTMPHKASGHRYPLCYPETGGSLGSSLSEMLLAVEQASAAHVIALAERYRAPEQPERPAKAAHNGDSPIERFNSQVGASAVLQREWHVERAAPGRSVRCPAHDDQHPSLKILPDDVRAYCHSPACEFHNGGRGRDAYDLWKLARERQAVAA